MSAAERVVSINARYRQHSLLLTGTYQDDRNRTDPTEDAYNDYIAYSPQWSFTAVYTFTWKKMSASLSHMFVDKRYWTAENAIEDPLPAYNCTDIKVGYRYGDIVLFPSPSSRPPIALSPSTSLRLFSSPF